MADCNLQGLELQVDLEVEVVVPAAATEPEIDRQELQLQFRLKEMMGELLLIRLGAVVVVVLDLSVLLVHKEVR